MVHYGATEAVKRTARKDNPTTPSAIMAVAAIITRDWRLLVLLILAVASYSTGSLTQSRSQNRQFQRAVKTDKLILVMEGIRARAINSVKPDPILLINFPEIDHQFKVSIS